MIGVGQQLGSYTIVRRLGQGESGELFLAEHRRVARRAAVKVLGSALSSDPVVLERFFADARNASFIKQPGMVEIFDCDLHEGQAFIMMEFLDGESLRTYLERAGALDGDLAFLLGIIAGAAATLAAAHAAGIVHGALRPENLFLHLEAPPDPSVTVKVLDFGIARLLRDRGTPTRAGARSSYMPPEQDSGGARPDAHADIYSLGWIFYEALCGRSPFSVETSADRSAPRPPAKIVPALHQKVSALMLRMLAENPELRPPAMAQVAATLRDCARAMGVDMDAQLQPLNAVERPVNRSAIPVGPRPDGRAATAQVPPREPTAPVAPPAVAAAPVAFGVVTSARNVGRTLILDQSGESTNSRGPGRDGPARALVGGTLVLDLTNPAGLARPAAEGPPSVVASKSPTARDAGAAAAGQEPVRGRAGGTLFLEEPAAGTPPEQAPKPVRRRVPHSFDATTQPTGELRADATRIRRHGMLFFAACGAAALAFAASVIFAFGGSAGTSPAVPRQTSGASRQPAPSYEGTAPQNSTGGEMAGPTATEPVGAGSVPPPAALVPGAPAVVSIDIHGLPPHASITVDDRATDLPVHVPRGRELHRIALRRADGSRRFIEVDGTRDRVIELVVDHPPKAASRSPSPSATAPTPSR